MTDASKTRKRQLAFELRSSRVFEKRRKTIKAPTKISVAHVSCLKIPVRATYSIEQLRKRQFLKSLYPIRSKKNVLTRPF